MFDLMYEARGLGLAANQVDLPIQMFVINLAADPDEGTEQVFINPVLSSPKGVSEAEEGCLSIAGINAKVTRPQQIHISAYDLQGNQIEQTLDGLLARAIQHETDHLNGVLFIDRLSEISRRSLADDLYEFEIAYNNQRSTGEVPDDQTILARLADIEAEYCS